MVKTQALATTEAVDVFGASVAFIFDPQTVTLARKPTFSEWADVMHRMKHAHDGLQFWIGDLILLGEAEFGEKAAQVLDQSSFADETIRNYRWAAEKIPPENRRSDLSFNHHVAVATMRPSDQKTWLGKAADGSDGESWSAERLRGEMAKAGAKPVELVFLLVVDCGTETKRLELSVDLQRQGFRTKTREQARRVAPVVTAKARRKRSSIK